MKITENMKKKYNEALFYWENSVFPKNLKLEMEFVPVQNSEGSTINTKGMYVLRLRIKLRNYQER